MIWPGMLLQKEALRILAIIPDITKKTQTGNMVGSKISNMLLKVFVIFVAGESSELIFHWK